MKKVIAIICSIVLCLGALAGCSTKKAEAKIGVSIGAGPAVRWAKEAEHMQQRADELGIKMEMRLNTNEAEKPQIQDCKELIDGGISVLIYMPRDTQNAYEVLDYARSKNVKVINYSRLIKGQKLDLYVGYDSYRIGQIMGQFISESAHSGDYIILKGDAKDDNATQLYDGAMKYINEIKGDINVLAEQEVVGWKPENAKEIVREAIKNNGNKVDAILAPNDIIAGACAEVVEELKVEGSVVITGMDADINAVKRIIGGKQSMTIYLDLHELAIAAIDQAVNLSNNQMLDVNSDFDNQSGGAISAKLINGKLVTKENVDRILIDTGYYTHEQVYGE